MCGRAGFEVEAASRAKFWTNTILSVLAGATERHAAVVLGLNRWLEGLLAKVIRGVRGGRRRRIYRRSE